MLGKFDERGQSSTWHTPPLSLAAKLVYVTLGAVLTVLAGRLPLTAVHAVQHQDAALVHLPISPSTHNKLRKGARCGVPSCLQF
jgi:hypothetical protein